MKLLTIFVDKRQAYVCIKFKFEDNLLNVVKEFKNSKKTGDLKYIYKNEIDKTCIAHVVTYHNDKHLIIRTVSHRFLKDIFYEVAINPKYDGYKRGLVSIEYTFFDKKIR